MEQTTHACSKCRRPHIHTFFAHKIPIPDTDQYDVEPEWICTDCMTTTMQEMITSKVKESQMTDFDPLKWMPSHSRISLEFEDEIYGSFSVRVWHGGVLESNRLKSNYLHTINRCTFIFLAENITRCENTIYSYNPVYASLIASDIKCGMDFAIANLYRRLGREDAEP